MPGQSTLPPAWLVLLVAMLTPPPGRENREAALKQLWRKNPSLAACLPKLPRVIAADAFTRARDAFYWEFAIAQMCILFAPYAWIISWPLLFVLGLTFACLLLWEGYIEHDQRPDCEAITTFMAPALILLFNSLLGLADPKWMTPLAVMQLPTLTEAIVIAIIRYLLAADPPRKHPYRHLLRAYNRSQFITLVWGAAGMVLLESTSEAVPISSVTSSVLAGAAITLFAVAKYLSTYPIFELSRHRRIRTTLDFDSDPDRKEVKAKRCELVTGSDWIRNWFRDFSVQAFLEIGSFVLAVVPLVVGYRMVYLREILLREVSWIQLTANAFGWVVVTWTFVGVKKMNRETAGIIDREMKRTEPPRGPLDPVAVGSEK
jgi:hypothetical protein